jgi:hypothetical protein
LICGIIGKVMKKDLNSSLQKPPVAEDLELVLEAARRANWDAQHGPAHLRTGRFFISEQYEAHASKPSTAVADADEQRSAS